MQEVGKTKTLVEGAMYSDLSKTHLICQSTVDTLLIQRTQPVQTLELVLLEGRHKHPGLLDSQLPGEGRGVLEVKLIRVH